MGISFTFRWNEDRQYVGDPQGALADFGFVVPFDDDTDLPSDATDTYHHEGRELWISGDGAVAFIVDGDGVEAWPTAPDPVGCT